MLQPLPGSTNGQEGSSWATHCCPPGERGGGKRSHDAQLATLPPSWDPETEEITLLVKFWVPLASGPTAEQKQKILHPVLLRGREWCGHNLPMSSLLPLWVAHLRASCTCGCRQVWRGPGRAGHPACDWLQDAAWWKAAAAAWERPRRRAG